ncbi:MAG: peptidase MA family metallohydrolase [Myxococcota bacterium]
MSVHVLTRWAALSRPRCAGVLPVVFLLATVAASSTAARAQAALEVMGKVEQAHAALFAWQLDDAVALAAEVEARLPDVPFVQALVGEVKFHQGDYEGAVRLLERAAEGGQVPPLLDLARTTRDETRGFISKESDHFVVRFPTGKDEVLADIALWALEKSFLHVSAAFDYRPAHKIAVDILHDARGLASVSTLTVKEIETSGTIALCKYNRLMVTSPKALARGYSWLDTLSHEFVHLVISEKSRNTVPIWLHEGLAKYSESLWRDGEPGLALDPASENLLAAAVKANDLVTFEEMHPSMAKLPSQERTALAFAEVFTVIEYLHRSEAAAKQKNRASGQAALSEYGSTNRLLAALASGKSMDDALRLAVGKDLRGLQSSWQSYLKRRPFRLTPGATPKTLRFVQDPRGRGGSEDEEEDEAALEDAKGRAGRKYVRLGNLLRQRGRLRASVSEYEKARVQVGARSPSLHNRMAGIYLELGDLQRGRTLLDETLRVFPDDPQTHVLLGRVALRSNDAASARTHYERATWENPFNPEIWVGLYRAAELLGDGELQARAQRNLRHLSGHAQKLAQDAAAPLSDDGEAFGTLSVTSRPWATVYLDGLATGMSTPFADHRLAPGSHRLRLEAPDGRFESVEVEVRIGDETRLDLSLREVSIAERERLLSLERPLPPVVPASPEQVTPAEPEDEGREASP